MSDRPIAWMKVTDEVIDVALHEELVDDPSAGGRVSFCGVVRNHDEGRQVVELEYQAHPSAESVLREIGEQFAALAEVEALAVTHRTGVLKPGDIALVAVVASAHRREAFDVCARLVDEVKHRLPIWKRQVFSDGTDEWVNCP